MKDDKSNGFVLNCGMAWSKPEYPHYQVDKAGQTLISEHLADIEDVSKLDDALTVINNWRSSHACPLQTIKMTLIGRAQKVDIHSIIAQRIKRLRAIRVKLLRGQNKSMKLSKMHDIGGCRAVLRSVSQVEELVNVYEKATAKNKYRGGEFVKKYDYIAFPKPDGYRGVHLVYKYISASPHSSLAVYNGLRIEIQLRSKLQHAWATAVETVDAFTGQALKSNLGDESWKRFFALVSTAFAQIEKRPIVTGTPSDIAELKQQLKSYNEQITVLDGLKSATESISKEEGHFFLLQLDSKLKTVKTTRFQQDKLNDAQNKYLDVEKENKDKPEMQTVLVSVDSVAHLRKAYPNYFLDISGFLMVLNKVLA